MVMNRAPGVEMVLLSIHFMVVILAQWVVVAPDKYKRSPPAVTQTRFTSALVGRMEATIPSYVTLRTWGMADFATKKMVLVPVNMRVPTPCMRHHKLLARSLIQLSPLGPRMRC